MDVLLAIFSMSTRHVVQLQPSALYSMKLIVREFESSLILSQFTPVMPLNTIMMILYLCQCYSHREKWRNGWKNFSPSTWTTNSISIAVVKSATKKTHIVLPMAPLSVSPVKATRQWILKSGVTKYFDQGRTTLDLSTGIDSLRLYTVRSFHGWVLVIFNSQSRNFAASIGNYNFVSLKEV